MTKAIIFILFSLLLFTYCKRVTCECQEEIGGLTITNTKTVLSDKEFKEDCEMSNKNYEAYGGSCIYYK